MSFPITFHALRENGVVVKNSPVDPLSGTSSLSMGSTGNEYDVIDPGLRKSASLFLREDGPYERGYIDGRIRTLLRRTSTDQQGAWGGIYIMSDGEGIGTRVSPGQNRYEITDKNGTIKLIKYTAALPTLLSASTQTFLHNVIHGFEVAWEYTAEMDLMVIKVRLGIDPAFTDLEEIVSYTDTSPHTIAVTEGLCVEAENSNTLLSYTFDKTSFYRLTHF